MNVGDGRITEMFLIVQDTSTTVFPLGIWFFGFFTLLFSWFFLKDHFLASIVVFVFSSVILYFAGPSALPFALCLSSGWILLNRFIERALPISDLIE